jgi:TonB family protein
MNSFAIKTLIALCLFLNNQPTQSPWEKQALADTQRTLASELDAELPRLSFADWFEKVVGPGTVVIWQLSECGELAEAAPNATVDMRACVEVNSILPNGRKVIVMIVVGTFKKGMTGVPAFHFGVIQQKDELYPIRRLRDLEGLLSEPGNLTRRPAVELPEVNTPKISVFANNAYLSGSPALSGEELSLPALIEEAPPPAPPPPARSAPSNASSTAENQSAPGGVLQGTPIFKAQAIYPQNAKRFNASGSVEVRVTISTMGRVTGASAISGHPLLRPAAVEAALKWIFKPTTVNGVPVETQLVLTFDFPAPR